MRTTFSALRWIPFTVAAAITATEFWLSFGTNSASPTPLLNDLKTAALFASPILAIALILAFSRPPQASYFMAAGVTGVLLLVLLLLATADQQVSQGVIHF
jgi:hypothetical protein